jgi:hypothetical protein
MEIGMGETEVKIKGVFREVSKVNSMIDQRIWPLLDIIGMVLLSVGAVLIMWSMTSTNQGPSIIIGAGIALIVISSIAIGFQGRKLRKKFERFHNFDDVRKEARAVPDDLEEGYFIDYTAEPGSVAVWSREPKKEIVPPIYHKM